METTNRNRTSKHHIRLVFKEKWKPNSIVDKTLYLYHKFGSNDKTLKVTPISIPMIAWDKKKQEIKEDCIKEYPSYVKWINNYKSDRPQILLDLYDNKINHNQAFEKILNIVEDGYILDKFEDFCKIKKKNRKGKPITDKAISKHITHIKALQTYFYECEAFELSRLKWSHIRLSSHHVSKIETLLSKNPITNETINRYVESLNYASYVNPNTTDSRPLDFRFDTSDDSSIKGDKNIERKELAEGIIRIGNNLRYVEAYLFWLLSFSLRGVDGADICVMDKSWLVDEKGKGVNPKDIQHYIPNYTKLKNEKKKGLKIKDDNKEIQDLLKNLEKNQKSIGLKDRFDVTDKKVYIRGYRTKTSNKKVGIKILFNHYPTLIIYRLLKHCIEINKPHLVYRGEDPMKLYNIDYHTPEGYKKWKNLRDRYTKDLKKLSGENAKLKHTRHTFTNELSNVYGGNGAEKLLSVSLGHRSKKLIEHYVKVPQSKMDILHLEVLKSYDINKILRNLIKYCSLKTYHFEGKERPLFKTEGIYPIVNSTELEALEIPLSTWSWRKEDEYQRLVKKENDRVFDSIDDNGNFIYINKDYSIELQELIKERELSIKEKRIKRPSINYNRETGQTETTFR